MPRRFALCKAAAIAGLGVCDGRGDPVMALGRKSYTLVQQRTAAFTECIAGKPVFGAGVFYFVPGLSAAGMAGGIDGQDLVPGLSTNCASIALIVLLPSGCPADPPPAPWP